MAAAQRPQGVETGLGYGGFTEAPEADDPGKDEGIQAVVSGVTDMYAARLESGDDLDGIDRV